MTILCISDTHNKHLEIPIEYLENTDNTIDTIIHAGDVSSHGYKGEIIGFLEWFNELNFKNKIFIAGNHDFYLERGKPEDIAAMLANYPNITYLNDSGIEIDGIKIWGSPVQPWFYDWAFNRKGSDICKHWNMIPDDINLLITHGPIKGYLDLTSRGDLAGCPNLLVRIFNLKNLKSHVCGHIHEGYGTDIFTNRVKLINASVLDHNYKMKNKPILIEI